MSSGDAPLYLALGKAADDLLAAPARDLDAILDQIVVAAVALVDAADHGGLTRTRHLTGGARHATDDVVHELDELQAEHDEGPCISVADGPSVPGLILVRDLAGADGERWPTFARHAVGRGFRSMLSVRLSAGGGRRPSSLNLYSGRPDAFGEEDQATAGLFALQASTLIHGADAAAGLGLALGNRDMIGRAKGLLMERFTLTDDAAFQMLVTTSQDTNMKLTEVARWLTDDADRRGREASGHRQAATVAVETT